jgi:hypothetical protein
VAHVGTGPFISVLKECCDLSEEENSGIRSGGQVP